MVEIGKTIEKPLTSMIHLTIKSDSGQHLQFLRCFSEEKQQNADVFKFILNPFYSGIFSKMMGWDFRSTGRYYY